MLTQKPHSFLKTTQCHVFSSCLLDDTAPLWMKIENTFFSFQNKQGRFSINSRKTWRAASEQKKLFEREEKCLQETRKVQISFHALGISSVLEWSVKLPPPYNCPSVSENAYPHNSLWVRIRKWVGEGGSLPVWRSLVPFPASTYNTLKHSYRSSHHPWYGPHLWNTRRRFRSLRFYLHPSQSS